MLVPDSPLTDQLIQLDVSWWLGSFKGTKTLYRGDGFPTFGLATHIYLEERTCPSA